MTRPSPRPTPSIENGPRRSSRVHVPTVRPDAIVTYARRSRANRNNSSSRRRVPTPPAEEEQASSVPVSPTQDNPQPSSADALQSPRPTTPNSVEAEEDIFAAHSRAVSPDRLSPSPPLSPQALIRRLRQLSGNPIHVAQVDDSAAALSPDSIPEDEQPSSPALRPDHGAADFGNISPFGNPVTQANVGAVPLSFGEHAQSQRAPSPDANDQIMDAESTGAASPPSRTLDYLGGQYTPLADATYSNSPHVPQSYGATLLVGYTNDPGYPDVTDPFDGVLPQDDVLPTVHHLPLQQYPSPVSVEFQYLDSNFGLWKDKAASLPIRANKTFDSAYHATIMLRIEDEVVSQLLAKEAVVDGNVISITKIDVCQWLGQTASKTSRRRTLWNKTSSLIQPLRKLAQQGDLSPHDRDMYEMVSMFNQDLHAPILPSKRCAHAAAPDTYTANQLKVIESNEKQWKKMVDECAQRLAQAED